MQTELEKKGIEARKKAEVENAKKGYSSEDSLQYNGSNKNALSDGDIKGKGTNAQSPGHVKGSRFDTLNGGGLYDIKGNPNAGDSGREFLTTINTYGPTNEYGINSIDTSENDSQGQINIKL